ncbi:MAG TPA: sigma-E factor negative regulatory protein [Methylophilaceae bacterium]|nr:sigma-E factor negative regulatory protein [Methylophilaceae bacterium]
MKDQISALMDDELALDGADHLFTAVKADEELEACWSTYHLIGDAMRGHPVFKPDFNERLMQKLDAEPAVLAPRASATKKSLVKTPVLWSVAASFAAVMFVGWVVLQQQVQTGADIAPQEVAQNLPSEYLLAHQAWAPSNAAYYIQPAAYAESAK